MRRRLLALIVVLVVSLAGTAACGDNVSPPAARVNNRAIDQDALDDELRAMTTNKKYLDFLESQGNKVTGAGSGTYDMAFVARVLTRQIYLELMHQEFVRRKLTLGSGDVDLVRSEVANGVGGPDIFAGFNAAYRNTLLRRSAEVAKLQQELSGAKVDANALRTFYDENTELFLETCVRHILFAALNSEGSVDTDATEARSAEFQAAAAATKLRLDAGDDFAMVARELSVDRGSQETGGDLGCGTSGRFVPEFETAADALAPGVVSEPVKSSFGWHLIRVDSRSPKAFDEVTDEIRQRLLGEAQEGFGAFLRESITEAKITVNPRYGRFDKSGDNPGVVPPTSPTTVDAGGPTGGGAGSGTDTGVPGIVPQG